jgi:hypothetical protein
VARLLGNQRQSDAVGPTGIHVPGYISIRSLTANAMGLQDYIADIYRLYIVALFGRPGDRAGLCGSC